MNDVNYVSSSKRNRSLYFLYLYIRYKIKNRIFLEIYILMNISKKLKTRTKSYNNYFTLNALYIFAYSLRFAKFKYLQFTYDY